MRNSIFVLVLIIFSFEKTSAQSAGNCGCGNLSGTAQILCMASCTQNQTAGQQNSPLNQFLPPGQLQGVQTQLQSLNNNLGTFNGNHASTNDKIDTFNQNHSATNGQLDRLNGNVERLSGQIDDVHQTVKDQTDRALDTADRFHTEYQRSNDLLERTLDPVFAAKMAAAAAIGASIAGLVIESAIKGFVVLYDVIKESITHEKERAQLLQNYFEAKKSYADLMSKREELLKSLEGMLKLKEAYHFFNSKTKNNMSQKQLKKEIRLGYKRLELASEQTQEALKSGESARCID